MVWEGLGWFWDGWGWFWDGLGRLGMVLGWLWNGVRPKCYVYSVFAETLKTQVNIKPLRASRMVWDDFGMVWDYVG